MKLFAAFILLLTSAAFSQTVQFRAAPVPDSNYGRDLGQSWLYWDSLYARYGTFASDVSVGGNLSVTGTVTLDTILSSGNILLNPTSNVIIGSADTLILGGTTSDYSAAWDLYSYGLIGARAGIYAGAPDLATGGFRIYTSSDAFYGQLTRATGYTGNNSFQLPALSAGTWTLLTTAGNQNVTDGGTYTIDALTVSGDGTFSGIIYADSITNLAGRFNINDSLSVWGDAAFVSPAGVPLINTVIADSGFSTSLRHLRKMYDGTYNALWQSVATAAGDWRLDRFSGVDTYEGSPFVIERTTGNITFGSGGGTTTADSVTVTNILDVDAVLEIDGTGATSGTSGKNQAFENSNRWVQSSAQSMSYIIDNDASTANAAHQWLADTTSDITVTSYSAKRLAMLHNDGDLVLGPNAISNKTPTGSIYAIRHYYTTTVFDAFGSGSPEGVVTAGIGSTYRRTDGGASTSFYVKESGTGNTGWVAK